MEFDPIGSAQSIPHMIKNDTLIEVLDEDQLSECLKHITLNVDDSLYILDRVQFKYDIPDRLKAIRHIITDFDESYDFDSKKFVEFIKSLGRCLQIDILESIATIIESTFSKIDQINSRKTVIQTQNQLVSTPHAINSNIEELKQIPKTEENFWKIYEICQRIATEKDKDAMSFAVREKFVYVIGKDETGQNIFTKAAKDNMQDLVRLLIETGVDINCKDNWNKTALIYASIKGHHEVVKFLLTVPGIDVNAKANFNKTALIFASYYGHHEIVKLLLTFSGIDVNATDKLNNTALILASWKNHQEVVELLLTVPGINVNAKDVDNNTALIWASEYGHHEIAKMLKAHGAI